MKNPVIKLAEKKQLRIVGLMSGTSVDGIDVAIADITPNKANLLTFDTFAYQPSLRKKIFSLFDPEAAKVNDICSLNFVLGEVFARAVRDLCAKAKIPISSIDLIGSHGQTIYHDPEGVRFKKRIVRSTLQIGEPAVIARRTGVTTIADFRVADVAAGGQGAPLVPYADFFLFQSKNIRRAIQNIGGIANVTFLPANCRTEDVIAFDTGPGNMVIDQIVVRITNGKKKYDKNGSIAAKGSVNKKLLKKLLSHSFIKIHPPKTTGREQFGTQYSDQLYNEAIRKKIPPADIAASVTAFTAHCIAIAYRNFLPKMPDQIILCGGGAHNKTLFLMLQKLFEDSKIVPMEDFGINVDAKEALSFAILAYAAIRNIPNNIPNATGAAKPVVIGKIVPAK